MLAVRSTLLLSQTGLGTVHGGVIFVCAMHDVINLLKFVILYVPRHVVRVNKNLEYTG